MHVFDMGLQELQCILGFAVRYEADEQLHSGLMGEGKVVQMVVFFQRS